MGCFGFEISLTRMPCKASQHSADVCFVARASAIWTARALLYGQHVHMTSVRCWVCPTTPAGLGFRRLSIFAYRLYDSVSGPGGPGPRDIRRNTWPLLYSPRNLKKSKICWYIKRIIEQIVIIDNEKCQFKISPLLNVFKWTICFRCN